MNQFKSIGAELMKRVAPTLEVMIEKLDNWVQSGGWQQVLGFVQSIANALLWMINNKEITGEDYLKILLEYEDQLISAKAKGIVED